MFAVLALAVGVLASSGCDTASSEGRVEAKYDGTTGKLSQLTVDSLKDGKPNITSYMNGTKFVRIEVDSNEDGRIDRWEYYGADQKVERVGFSRANDGKPDAWATRAADGSLSRLEISTRHDGAVNRIEFYEAGQLARAEEDTDADGRPDKWEKYDSGELVSVSFDTLKSGKPTTTVDYRK